MGKIEKFVPEHGRVGLTGKVAHFETAAAPVENERDILERAATHSDRAAHEELITTLNTLLNNIGAQAAWIEDLDASGREDMNRIAAEYLEAQKKGASLKEKLALQQEFEKLFVI